MFNFSNFDSSKLPLKYDAYDRRSGRTLEITYKDHSITQIGLYIHNPLDFPYFNSPSYPLKKIGEKITLIYDVNRQYK